LQLFQERGYDATTTAAIAARADVTERTFFRHFADKREALFDGEEAFRTALGNAVRVAPEGLGPIAALLTAFRSVEPTLARNRSFTEPRQAVIARSPALQERVLMKTATLTAALAEALRYRGVKDGVATLAAQAGMAAFSRATHMWLADPAAGLNHCLDRAMEELRGLTSPPGTKDTGQR